MKEAIFNLLNQKWAIDENYAIGAGALVHSILMGTEYPKATARTAFMRTAEGNSYASVADMPEGSIAIIAVNGVMTRGDQWCGPAGTASIAKAIREADASPRVSAIIIEWATPGGSVDGTEALANTIKGTKKPIYSHVQYAFSAGYWGASAADEVWLEGETSEVGSIGTMVSFTDMKGYWEKQGVVFHEITATASADKNAAFAEAKKGNYEPVIAQILDPINEVFMATMRKHRNLKDELMTGKTYIASAAIKNGMADRIGSLGQLVEHIKQVNSKTTNMSEKKSLFGITWGGDDAPKKAAEEIAGLQAQNEDLSDKLAVANSSIEELMAAIKSKETALDAANAALATAQQERDSFKALAEKYGAKPAANATVAQKAAPEGEAESEKNGWFDPNASHNREAEAIFNKIKRK